MMPDISDLMAPKSDQLGGDDFVTGPVTAKIIKADRAQVDGKDKVRIFLEGYDRFWLPCKTTLRIMAAGWQSSRTEDWIGRYVTVFRDPTVVYGGAAIGGIRVSAMSHIDRDFSTPVAISKTIRKVWKVQALEVPAGPAKPNAPADDSAEARAVAARGTDAFRAWWSGRGKDRNAHLAPILADLKAICAAADAADAPADPFALTPDQIEAKMASVAAELAGK